MNLREAVAAASMSGEWPAAGSGPISVNVGFLSGGCKGDETQFDLCGGTSDEMEKELCSIWDEMHKELGSEPDGVTYVEALGYIAD